MSVDGVVARNTGAAGDPDRAHLLDELYAAVVQDRTGGSPVRSLVSESWQRSLAADIDPDRRTPPITYDRRESRARLSAHPLHTVMPLLRSNLVSIADEAMHVVLVTDADGVVLWREGASAVLRPADRVGLVEGSRWSEDAMGTNAMGTTLAVDRPVQIHSTEHLVRTIHAWTCVAAPVHDPDTGRIIGAIDITGPRQTIHPAMLALVTTTAQLAENQLRVQLAIADERMRQRNMPHLRCLGGTAGALVTPTGRVVAGEPYGWWPERVPVVPGADRVELADGRVLQVEPLAEGYLLRAVDRSSVLSAGPRSAADAPETAAPERHALTLRFMGDGTPRAVLDGTPIPMTLRPAEMLTALALHPEGLTAEQLAFRLYGDDGNQTTVRGEVRRLRASIGVDVLRTRPYRLDATVDTDFGAVRRALEGGRVAEAIRACSGPLLPRSDAPEIRDVRDELATALRRAVLDSDDVSLLHTFGAHALGRDDLEVHERLADLLPAGDPRRAVAESRVSRLLAE
ncbi:MAG: GAF domain-containing protein [Pseudonocardia sp.]|nr:GAF domain-containing protein [Pseudonocardia sp.]